MVGLLLPWRWVSHIVPLFLLFSLVVVVGQVCEKRVPQGAGPDERVSVDGAVGPFDGDACGACTW